jgi:hypothetical protein
MWVQDLEKICQFDMIVEEYVGVIAKSNQWRVGCSYVACPFQILFDYSLQLKNDYKIHEIFTKGDEIHNKIFHFHDETQ